MDQQTCSACGGELVAGFPFGRLVMANAVEVEWHEGTPERGMLGGLKESKGSICDMLAYRCAECSQVTWFASERE